MNIDYITLSDASIVKEMGARLKALRLRKNLRRKDLANTTLLSIDTIKRLEAGQGRLLNLIALLRGLDALEQLDAFIPPVTIDPISMANMQGKVRQRASGERQ